MNNRLKELHRSQNGMSGDMSFGRVLFTPYSEARLELCATLRNIAKTRLHPDVARDFGDELVSRYANTDSSDLLERCRKLGKTAKELEAYIVTVTSDVGSILAAGVATISPCEPAIVEPTEDQSHDLMEYLPGLRKGASAVVGAYWFGILDMNPMDEATMRTRDSMSRSIAKPLVARLVEIARANRIPAVTFEVPTDESSVSSGMRQEMLPTGLIACWKEPVANPDQKYELLVAE